MAHHVLHPSGHDVLDETPSPDLYDDLTDPVVVHAAGGRTEHYYAAGGVAVAHSVSGPTGMLSVSVVDGDVLEVFSPTGWVSVSGPRRPKRDGRSAILV